MTDVKKIDGGNISNRIQSFYGLKLIALFAIFWWHSGAPQPNVNLGARACEFFFVVSGFLVMHNSINKNIENTWSCLESFIYDFKIKKPNTKIGFVLTEGKKYPNQSQIYWNAAISVFEKYDISYIDFRNIDYPTIDGTHPSCRSKHICKPMS